jgi:DNA-binding IclR family transcriptional regulator
MLDEITVSARDYAVLSRVPAIWFDLDATVDGIADNTQTTKTDVRRRLSRLCVLGLAERRKRNTLTPTFEVRRIAKD